MKTKKIIIYSLLALVTIFQANFNGFSQNLNYSWGHSIAPSGTSSTTLSVATDSLGNSYELGRQSNFGTVDYDPGLGVSNLSTGTAAKKLTIRKLDANGDFVWLRYASAGSGQP